MLQEEEHPYFPYPSASSSALIYPVQAGPLELWISCSLSAKQTDIFTSVPAVNLKSPVHLSDTFYDCTRKLEHLEENPRNLCVTNIYTQTPANNARGKLTALKERKHGDCTRRCSIKYLIQVVKDYRCNNTCSVPRTTLTIILKIMVTQLAATVCRCVLLCLKMSQN